MSAVFLYFNEQLGIHMKTRYCLLKSIFAFFLMFLGGPAIGASYLALGPLITKPVATYAESKEQVLLPANFAGAKEIRLGTVTSAEIDSLKKLNADNRAQGKPLVIGFPRTFPEVLLLSENSLSWVTLQDGSKVAQVKITSPAANALRLGLNIEKMDDGVELRLIGNGMPTEVIGPITIRNINSDLSQYWLPIISGDTATLEIHLPPKPKDSFVAKISLLSHFATNPGSPDRAKLTDAAMACEVDIACVNDANVNMAANGVARMIFTKNGVSGYCTGSLLNNTNEDLIPYFLTAAHCINDQSAAATLQTFWFYRASTCGGAASYIARYSGAQLLYTSPTTDVTLLKLYDTPPSGVTFLGWDSNPLSVGSNIVGLHHPRGAPGKISVGSIADTNFSFSVPGASFNNFLRIVWNAGLTEPGSSGSSLFSPGSFSVRGVLSVGPSQLSCTTQVQQSLYSPLSTVSPSLARWLTPTASQVQPQTGWWWNPSESGRGFSIEVSGNRLFMAGYLYAANTGQAFWFSSGGSMSSSSTYQGAMTAYGYGQTLTGGYIAPVSTVNMGTISLNFTDATHGVLTWPGGSIPIERFNIVANGINAPRASFQPETGWWWNPSENGRGFALEIQNGVMFLAGYMYDGAGNPIWYSSANQMSSQGLYQGNWAQYANGQTLSGSYRPPALVSGNVGSLQIQFQTTTSGTLTLPDGRSIPITRFRF